VIHLHTASLRVSATRSQQLLLWHITATRADLNLKLGITATEKISTSNTTPPVEVSLSMGRPDPQLTQCRCLLW